MRIGKHIFLSVRVVALAACVLSISAKADAGGFTIRSSDPALPPPAVPGFDWHTFYGNGASDDVSGVAVDGDGNIYVAGGSTGSWNGPAGQPPLHPYSGAKAFFVLKLDSAGAYQWHSFFGSGADPQVDEARGIAVDGTGNVYVTGTSPGSWNGPAGQEPLNAFAGFADAFVLKLDPQGTYQWHTFYGSGGLDEVSGLAAGTGDAVYLLGACNGTWNGPAGQSPLHAFSGGSPGPSDIFVLKLAAGGAYQWHTFYGAAGADDSGYDIALDGSGNVYLGGESTASWNGAGDAAPLHALVGGGDIFALKLDTGGGYQWHSFYGSTAKDEQAGIAIDGAGNVYLGETAAAAWDGPTGQPPLHTLSEGPEIAVLKLNTDGAYQWHTFYGSSAFYGSSNLDYGHDIAVDAQGAVSLVGTSWGSWNGPLGQPPMETYRSGVHTAVLSLDANGQYRGHAFFPTGGSRIALDDTGGVFVAGGGAGNWKGPIGQEPLTTSSGYLDVFLLTLKPTSELRWQWRAGYHPAAAGYNMIQDVAVGNDGRLLATGYVSDNGLTSKWWIGKYSPGGARLWQKLISVAGQHCRGNAVAVARDGSVYVTGMKISAMWLLKYSPSGRLVWQYRLPAYSGLMDVGVSARGFVYVYGTTPSLRWGSSAWLGKFSPAGKLLWQRTYNMFEDDSDNAGRSLAIASDESVVVLGDTRNDVWTPKTLRVWIQKYSAAGTRLWHRAVSTNANRSGAAIALGSTGEVHILAVSYPSQQITKFSAAGKPLWSRSFDEYDKYGFGQIQSLAVSGSTVFAAGSPGDYANPWLMKIAGNGTVLQTRPVDRPDWNARAQVVATGKDGSVYLGGGEGDLLLVKYRQ